MILSFLQMETKTSISTSFEVFQRQSLQISHRTSTKSFDFKLESYFTDQILFHTATSSSFDLWRFFQHSELIYASVWRILLSKRCTDLVIYRLSYPRNCRIRSKLPKTAVHTARPQGRHTYIFLEIFGTENQGRLHCGTYVTTAVIDGEINTSTCDVLISFTFSY